MRRQLPMLLCTVALAATGCESVDSGSGSSDAPQDPVAEYCAYGAVSDAQLAGCESHVEESDIDALDTNAAEYSRGNLNECLDDAGPFCEDR